MGPTGVGKTTTIAKLAARAARVAPDSVLVITTDVHRVAAIEQMVRFGEMISVPVEVAISPADLTRALAQAEKWDRIFVDTTGRSPRDIFIAAPAEVPRWAGEWHHKAPAPSAIDVHSATIIDGNARPSLQ